MLALLFFLKKTFVLLTNVAINNWFLLCGLSPQKFMVRYGFKFLLGHIIINKKMLVRVLVDLELFKMNMLKLVQPSTLNVSKNYSKIERNAVLVTMYCLCNLVAKVLV